MAPPSYSMAARRRRAPPGCCAVPASAGWRWWWPPMPRATTTAACERCWSSSTWVFSSTVATAPATPAHAVVAEANAAASAGFRPGHRSICAPVGSRVHVLSPAPRPPGPPPDDPNRRAVVAVVSVGAVDLLLSGDAESDALSSLELPDVDAIKVPHHGSADPGLPAVLRRLRPELAIEVGRGNSVRAPGAVDRGRPQRARVRLSHRPSRDRRAHSRGWPPRGRRAPTLDSPQWLS